MGLVPSNASLITWVSLRYKYELRARTRSRCEERRESGLDRNTVLYPGPAHVILHVGPFLTKLERPEFSGNQMHPIITTQSPFPPPNQLNCFVLGWIILNLHLYAATAVYYR